MSSIPMTSTPQGKDRGSQPRLGLAQIMQIFLIMIPLMLLGFAIAVVPLLAAIRHQDELEDVVQPAAVPSSDRYEQIAA